MKNDNNLNFENHIKKVNRAIEKINNKVDLEEEEIREVLKSLMNSCISISERFDNQIDELGERFKKLENFLFRKNHKREDKNG
jgi:hypothetical protein